MRNLISIGIFSLLLLPSITHAQTVALERFAAQRFGASVLVDWTLAKGFKCADMELWHGTDSTDLAKIYTLYGICGFDSVEGSYDYVHFNINKTTYDCYQLRIKNTGNSNVICIENYPISGYKIISSTDYVLLEIDNFNSQMVSFYLYNAKGSQVMNKVDTRESSLFIPHQILPTGIYYFTILYADDTKLEGKFHMP